MAPLIKASAILALLLVSSCFTYAAKPRGASLTLKARFSATSYLLEAVEFLAEEDASLVWTFLDRLTEGSALAAGDAAGDDACWSNITKATAELVTPGVGKLVPLVLGSRQYAAKLQMIRQLAEQFHGQQSGCCFVAVDGHVATSPQQLSELLKSKPPVVSRKGQDGDDAVASEDAEQLFPFDHVYYRGGAAPAVGPEGAAAAAPGGSATRRTAVLYGSPGLSCFAPLHRQLKAAAEDPRVGLTYAFRPLLQPQCEASASCARAGTGGQLLLPGWGVEAALKNTEYSAMDDKEAAKQRQLQQDAAGAGDDADVSSLFGSGDAAVVKGFRLDVLAARRPSLRQELLTFRDQLLAADDGEEALKVWDLRDVGLQATQRILGSSDPLGLLAELSQNFPGLVSSLSRQTVNATLRSAVSHNQQMLSAGSNYLLLNGLAVDVNDFDYFGFLNRLRSELRLRDALVAPPLELPAALAQQVMALRAEEGSGPGGGGGEGGGGEGGEPRLSLGPTVVVNQHVAFLNDLERDARYQRLPQSVSELLNTFPGRLRPIARNVFTAVLVVQPLCGSSLELAVNVERMWQGGYPIRFGVVFHLPAVLSRVAHQRRYPFMRAAPTTWEAMDVSERFGRAFATLREAFGTAVAWDMWTSASEEVAAGEVADPGAVVEAAFMRAWSSAARHPPPGARAKIAARKSAEAALSMLKNGEGYAAEVGMQLTDTASWLLSRGLVQPSPGSSSATAPTPTEEEDSEVCDIPPVVWLNGLVSRPAGSPVDDLMYKVMGEMQRLQELIYFGRLDDHSAGGDMLAAVLAAHGAVERLNPRIVGAAAKNAQIVPLAPLLRHPAHSALVPLCRGSGGEEDSSSTTSSPATGKSKDKKAKGADSNSNGNGGNSDAAPQQVNVAAATHYVAADLSTDEGRALVAEAVRFLAMLNPATTGRAARLVLLVNPADPGGLPTLLEGVIQAALGEVAAAPGNRDKVITFLHRLLSDAALVSRLGGDFVAGSAEEASVAVKYASEAGLDGNKIMAYLVRLVDETLQVDGQLRGGTPSLSYRAVQGELCRTVFGLEPGAAAVISNGRVTPVLSRPGAEFQELLAEDLSLLQRMAGGGVAAAVARTLQKAHQEEGTSLKAVPTGDAAKPAAVSAALSDLAAALTAALGVAARAAPSAAGGAGGGAAGGSRLNPGASLQLQQIMANLKGQALQVPGGPDAPFHLEAVLNPLSRPAQRLSAVLLALREALGPSMSLALNPQRDITEMPLKSYYRYALPQGLTPAGGPPGSPTAYFSRLPSRRVLTINMDVPEAWLVEPSAALYDLDNLRLEDVAGEVAFAEYELDALMLTGSCVDVTASGRMTPPRGLQLHLGTPSQPHQVDTLVMANLAYFQLKAAPGLWLLSLAPGRSLDLYTLQSSTGASQDLFGGEEEEERSAEVQQTGAGGSDVSTQVVISSFMGKHMILRVRKRPGMENEDVLKEAGGGEAGAAEAEPPADDSYEPAPEDLEDDEYDDEDEKPSSGKGLLGRVSSMLSRGGGKDKDKDKHLSSAARRRASIVAAGGEDRINVFTVASGHMYERLQNIMILSVVRNTQARVKFWIIKDYMSPKHKQVLPALADKYRFDYEFVTYKWPHWLHKQTDKQRLIWAYKILFLDVLFPLGLDRIIFVDSDQVVRTDLADLYHMDIKGAPYAYTPFCDNNKEMDEYRFWKGGFWRDHLQGKPYHISALYLVDLKRFRQIAAGDQLRVVYDQLSKDPNSLANLDQDLPNYAQHSIRIFSLPQEWLWCESWCGNATKDKAKTIDLCNNPKTKEPKLTAARRIIGPLWEELDRQQEGVTRDVQELLEAQEAGLSEGEAEGGEEGRHQQQEQGQEQGQGEHVLPHDRSEL